MDLIECLRSCRNAPRVIVFSPVADDRLWMDVLHGGGYDLLGTPFERAEVHGLFTELGSRGRSGQTDCARYGFPSKNPAASYSK